MADSIHQSPGRSDPRGLPSGPFRKEGDIQLPHLPGFWASVVREFILSLGPGVLMTSVSCVGPCLGPLGCNKEYDEEGLCPCSMCLPDQPAQTRKAKGRGCCRHSAAHRALGRGDASRENEPSFSTTFSLEFCFNKRVVSSRRVNAGLGAARGGVHRL